MDPQSTAQAREHRSFIGTATMVMAAFALSRCLGLLRAMLQARAFGTSAEQDAFRAASQVTDILYILVAGGALASAFIPTFTAYLARGERRTAWRVASAVIDLVFLVTLFASLVTALIAPWLVANVLAPGYAATTQQLTVSLLRWMLSSTVIFGVSGLLMGILNANDHFLLPALAPSLYNLGIIGGILLLSERWGVYSAAVGTVLGALMHLAVQLPALLKLDWAYAPILGLRLEGVREVGRLFVPRVIGLAITQLNFVVNTNLGSRILAEGVVSALDFGWRLMLLPQGIFAQAIATVLFPFFSAQAARGERRAMRETLVTALQVLIYLTLPATVGLIVLRRPLVALLFMGGRFGARSVDMVAWALAYFAVGLVAHSALEVVTRGFYALHDTATPVWVGGGAMTLNLGLSLLLVWLFEGWGTRFLSGYQSWMPLGGLALANSIATVLETGTLTWLLRRRLGGLDVMRLWASLWRSGLGAAAMGAVLLVALRFGPTQSPWLLGLGGMVAGTAVFVVATWLLRSPEIALIVDAVRRRLGQ